MGILAAITLFLSVSGIYAVLAYSVSQRTHEIGVRIALGAQPRDILRLVIGQGLKLTVIGLLLGFPAAVAETVLLSSFLFGVSSLTASSFAALILFFCGISILACYLPARRATKIDPMVALRYE